MIRPKSRKFHNDNEIFENQERKKVRKSKKQQKKEMINVK